MSSPKKRLAAYLGDHLAGSAAALDLIEKLRSNNEGTPLATFLGQLGPEVAADQTVLQGLIEQLGEPQGVLKKAGGWAAEKLTRVRLDERVTRSPDLSRLLELEMLAVGVEGKRALWTALRPLTGAYPAVAALDLDGLLERADAQRRGVEDHRVEAATRAFR